MNKESIATAVRIKTRMDQKKSREAVATIFNVMSKALVEEGVVVVRGFGTFSLLKKKERAGRNPSTGEPAIIKARTVVKFKAGGKMYDSVVGG